MIPVTAITRSLSGLAWRWRGGNMDLTSGGFGQLDSLVDQLLMARGVERHDLERHRRPTLRDFLPDPSIFNDMDAAAQRFADAITKGEAIVSLHEICRETGRDYGDHHHHHHHHHHHDHHRRRDVVSQPPSGTVAGTRAGAGAGVDAGGGNGHRHPPRGMTEKDGIFKTVAVYFRVLGIFDTVDEAKGQC